MSKTIELARHLETLHINDMYKTDFYWTWDKTDEEIDAKFGFLVDAYKYGAPPHGGAALGLDRIVMTMCECDNLRDVVAFPKVQNAGEPMSGCPETVEEKQLRELSIAYAPIETEE